MAGEIRTRAFIRLWLGGTASGLATWALPFVLGIAVLDRSITAAQLGIALAARTVGFLVALPISGVLADRSARRKVVWGASLIAAAGIALIVIGLGHSAFGTALLMLGAAVAGIGQGACRPAYNALVPIVVGVDGLQPANAAMSISVRVATLVGPTLATALALGLGVWATLIAIALLWLVSGFVPPHPVEPGRPDGADARLTLKSFHQELIEGVREAGRHPWFVAGLAALTIVIALGYSVTNVILPIVSRDDYGGAVLLVAGTTAYTIGALLGAAVMAYWRPRNQGWTALGALALYGLVPFSLIAPIHIAIPIAALFLAGLGVQLFNVPWFSATQREVPSDKLARVSSVDFLFSYGLAPLGLALIAPLSQALGPTPVLVICGCACFVAPALAMLPKSSRTFTSA
ncbi:MAG: MFS transporter [Alphaproteobacteria bacterium]|nr:MFS transporter [Alphaproteobacteria bacterium]